MAVAGAGGAPGGGEAELADISISSEDLFRSAMAPDAPAAPPDDGSAPPPQPGIADPQQSAPPGPQPQLRMDDQGRLRDPATGRYASPAQTAEHQRQFPNGAPPQQAPQRGDFELPEDPHAMVPSWRLREEREGRETVASQFQQMQQRYDRLLEMMERQQAAAPKPPPQPTFTPQLPDPVIDPIGYHQGMQAQFQTALQAVMLENNLRMTALEVGKQNFQAAYNAFLEAGKAAPDFARSVVNSEDPGARMMSWYNNQRVLSEIGGDPHAWMARQLEQALANPAFLQRAVEAATAQARGLPAPGQGNGQQRMAAPQPQFPVPQRQQPRSVVNLPPSLSTMRGASGDGAGEMVVDYGNGVTASDDDLFRSAMAPPQRSR